METTILGRPTFGGLASGLDTNALLEGLLAIERQPLQRLESRRAEINNQRSLMRTLNTKVMALRDAAREIDNRNSTGNDVSVDEEFLRYAGSSTNEDVVTVSAGFGAAPGNIEIFVDRLATSSREFSVSFASADNDQGGSPALLSGQSFTIDLPNGDSSVTPEIEPTSITIDADSGDLSLQDIRDQINTSAENGGNVRADVLQISDTDFRLVLTSTGTGASNQLSITGDLGIDATKQVLAVDSEIRVFGEIVNRESNVIDDVLTGVTLRLEGLSELDEDNPGDPDAIPVIPPGRLSETVTIDVDNEEVAKGLDKFVKAYNDVMSFIDGQFRYNESSNTAGPLSGDFTLRDVQRQLREMVSTGFTFETNPNNPFAPSQDGAQGGTITGIGIEIIDGGRLRVNQEKLEEALALNPNSVREFLTGRIRATAANQQDVDDNGADPDLYDEGFAQLVATQLEQIVRSGDGTLASRDDAFAKRIREFDTSIDRFEQRLSKREESLVLKFSQLERIVSGLQSQQGFLSSLQ